MSRSSYVVSFFHCWRIHCWCVLYYFWNNYYTEKKNERWQTSWIKRAFLKHSLQTYARTKAYYVRNMHVAIAQRNAWQVQLPRHSKQTNFYELRFHEACFRETAVLSFNCSGTVHGKIITRCIASLHCLPGNGTERKADTQSGRKISTMTRWSLFRETQTHEGFREAP